MSLRITRILARTTRKMKLSSTEEGKTACGTVLVLSMLSCVLESTWGCVWSRQLYIQVRRRWKVHLRLAEGGEMASREGPENR